MNIDNMTEDQAMHLVWKLANKFDWKLALFSKSDVQYSVASMLGERTNDFRGIVDEVLASRSWRKGLEEILSSEGTEYIQWMIGQSEKFQA